MAHGEQYQTGQVTDSYKKEQKTLQATSNDLIQDIKYFIFKKNQMTLKLDVQSQLQFSAVYLFATIVDIVINYFHKLFKNFSLTRNI